MSAGLNAVAAGANIWSGFARSRAAREEAMAAEYRAGINRLRARQQGAQGAESVVQTLAAIQTLRAGRGLSADSPTAALIRRGIRRRGADATNNAVLTSLLGADAEMNNAAGLRRSAPLYVVQGFANGLQNAAQAVNAFGGSGGGGGGG